MAVTAIWNITGSITGVLEYTKDPDKTINPENLSNAHLTQEEKNSLMNVLEYAANKKKVSDESAKEYFVSGINCDPENAAFEMMTVKKQYRKLYGNTAYHAYQSFAKGEVTPKTAHEIGKKLAMDIWGDRFQVVVATHLDQEHLHNHYVLNSVSFRDGGKYNDCNETYRKLRNTSDRLCREYGLSVIENPKPGKTKHYVEWRAERDGKPTWRGIIKADVDEAIKSSMTDNQFFTALKDKGYEIKIGKDISVRPPGKKRYLRLARNFGDGYAIDSINQRILAQQTPVRPAPPRVPNKSRYRHTILKRRRRRISGLRGLYLYYQYLLGNLPKRRTPRLDYFVLKADLIKMNNISAETKLLFKYKIETAEELEQFRKCKLSEIKPLAMKRSYLRKSLKWKNDEDKDKIKMQINSITKSIREITREIKLAEDIADRSGVIRENISHLKEAAKEKEKEKKKEREEEKDERIR